MNCRGLLTDKQPGGLQIRLHPSGHVCSVPLLEKLSDLFVDALL